LGFLTYRLLCHTPAKIRSRAVLIRGPHISAPLCLPHNAGTSRRFLECVATSGGVPVTAAAYTAGWLTGGSSLLRPEAPRSTTVMVGTPPFPRAKQEIGLGHYEGRGWPGFHHHATLCIAVYGFLISERETIPPSGPHCAWRVKKPAIPDSYRPRGAADPTPTPRSQLDRDAPSSADGRDRKDAPKMPLLCKPIQKKHASHFVTQYD
jgi:hypothetical protein